MTTYPKPADPVSALTRADGSTEAHSHDHGHVIEMWQNVKHYGAYGDGSHDDTDAIEAALAAAQAGNGGSVFFPPGVYHTTRTIDLSFYGAQHLLGGQWSASSMDGSVPPHVWVGGGGTGPTFYWDDSAGGRAASVTFENLMVTGTDQALHIKDGAQFRAKNCGFRAEDTAATYNTPVLLQNTFWTYFTSCAFSAASASKYGVIALAKAWHDTPTNLLTIRDAILTFGGAIHYIVDGDITGSLASFIFDNCQTESASLPFFSVKEVSGTTTFHMQHVQLNEITMADNLVSPLPLIDWDATHGDLSGPLVKSSLSTSGIVRRAGTISGARFEGMHGTGGAGYILNAAGTLDTVSSWSAQVGSSLTMHADDTGTPTENLWWKDGGPPLKIFRSGDENARYGVDTAGKTWWGAGGVTAWDTNLYRRAADQLKTDDKLLAAAGFGVGNSAAATEIIGKAVTKKIEVFDASGVSLGFIPVYSSIT